LGLTIHYNLNSSTRSPKKARELVARLRGRALDLPFERVDDIIELSGPQCDYEQCGQDHPHRWLLIQAGAFVDDPRDEHYSYGVKPTHIIAFATWPGEGCEQANFGLCRYPAYLEVQDRVMRWQTRKIPTRLGGWCWGSFCKTQYASNPECGGVANFLRCHLSVIRMLDHAKDLGILQSVSDEGDFWEKRNIEDLSREVGQWNQMIAAWAGQLKDQLGPELLAAITDYPNFERLEAAGRSQEGGFI
jgi:hypothetical protein